MEEQKIKHEKSKSSLDWESQTVFKDVVLGYINVPKAVVNTLIDNIIFQRLHDVAQTGMETLYPGATHNRFCHSIGVYHLGKLAFQCFQQNVKNQHLDDIYYKVAASDEACDRVWNRWRFLFECACLLHDCGHSPLSHSLEFLYDSIEIKTGTGTWEISGSDKILLQNFHDSDTFSKYYYKKRNNKNSANAYGSQHERMSAHLVINKSGYRNILCELIKDQMLHFDSSEDGLRAVQEYDEMQLQSDLEFMVRMIIGYPYNKEAVFGGEEQPQSDAQLAPNQNIIYQLRNCIIRLLNGIIDVDNIDYSIRDASASGYKSAQVDYERLLKAETIALAYDHNQAELNVNGEPFDYSVRLHRFESKEIGENDEPLNMTISGSATLLIQQTQNKGRGTSGNLEITGNIIEDDESCNNKKNVRVIHIQNGSNVHINLSSGKLQIRPRNCDEQNGTQIYLRSDSLCGTIRGSVFVGSYLPQTTAKASQNLRDKILTGDLKIYPAYHKSALSVLQGALDATNFESKWIYSHHVTTYNNNFLSVFLLEKCAEYLFVKEYNNIFTQLDLFLPICGKFISKVVAVDEAKVSQCIRNAQNVIVDIELKAPELKNVRLCEQLSKVNKAACPEVLYILLDVLCILCRNMPVEDNINNLKMQFCDGILNVVDKINTLLQQDTSEEKPSMFEENLYNNLVNLLMTHEGYKMGMATMSAILGMPDVKRINGQNYFRTSDADLRSMYHNLAQNATVADKSLHKDFFNAIGQYESRQYLAPMWKSHAEFHFYTQGWKKSWFYPEKSKATTTSSGSLSFIDSFFSETTTPYDPKDQKNHRSLYVYFSDNTVKSYADNLKSFWAEVRDKFNIDILVYVPQKIRHKKLDDDSTYIVWKNRIVTMRDIGFQVSQSVGKSYFYLYYELKSGHADDLNVSDFMEFLKEYLEKIEKKASGQYS